MTPDTAASADPGAGMMGLAILLGIIAIAYVGWFFGRVHEAQVEHHEEQLEEAAWQWAARHGKLPEPEVVIRYVDLETGIVLEDQQG